jgi:hypothetical protein
MRRVGRLGLWGDLDYLEVERLRDRQSALRRRPRPLPGGQSSVTANLPLVRSGDPSQRDMYLIRIPEAQAKVAAISDVLITWRSIDGQRAAGVAS